MGEASVDSGFEFGEPPLRGTITVDAYSAGLLARSHTGD
jgi:hypothetical protein